MARTVQQGFDDFLARLTPLQSQIASAKRHRSSVKTSLSNSLVVRNLWETGSFHHGTGVRNYSDVDVLVSLGNTQPSPDTALRWVESALSASFPSTTVKVRKPAVVVEFSGGAETWEVIPGFIKSSAGTFVYQIPGPAGGWIETAPKAHLEYVNECNELPGRQGGAKKLARLIKAWKYYNSVPISSFYIEMRAAEYLASQESFVPIYDVCWFLEWLLENKILAMNDPKRLTGRFHPCSSDPRKEEALSKLNTAATRARKALDYYADNRPDWAFYYLDLLFGNNFPAW